MKLANNITGKYQALFKFIRIYNLMASIVIHTNKTNINSHMDNLLRSPGPRKKQITNEKYIVKSK